MARGILEEQRRPTGAQHAITDLGHFQARIDLDTDAFEFTQAFELRDEVPQVVIFHQQLSLC